MIDLGVIAMWYFNNNDTDVQFPSLVVAAICIFSYFIASAFMATYKMTIDVWKQPCVADVPSFRFHDIDCTTFSY